MTRDELASDLSYVRALAEEGRKAPLIGGSILVFFGVLLAIAYSAQWALLAEAFGHANPLWYPVVWIGFGVAASIGAPLLRGRVKNLPGAESAANRVDRVVWQGVGAGIMAVVVGAIGHSVASHDYTAPNVIMAFGFGVYGIALRSTAIFSESGWLRPFALFAFVWSAILWFFVDQPWAYLLAAAGCVVVLIIPGAVMMRRQPAALA